MNYCGQVRFAVRVNPLLRLVTSAALLLLTACGGSEGGGRLTTAPGGAGEVIPLPLELHGPETAQRSASLSEADVFRLGSEFTSGFGLSRVSAAGGSAVFSPDSAAADSLSDFAWAIYSFNCSDYDREPLVDIRWDTAPGGGDLYIGISDFTDNRWHWFVPSSNPLQLAGIEPHISPTGQLFVVVLVQGDSAASLASLRLGEVYPYAELVVSPLEGTAPLSVTLDASGSMTPEGSLALFEWDFDGDGVYDETGTVSTIEHVYAEGGSFTASVRVTNSEDNSATAVSADELIVHGQWVHTLCSAAGSVGFETVAVAPDGSIFAAGYSNDVTVKHLLVSKWDRSGAPLWVKTYDPLLGNALVSDLAIDGGGNVVLAGTLEKPSPMQNLHFLMQKWSADGELMWSRAFLGEANDLMWSVAVDGSDYFFTGESASFGSDADTIICRLNGDGAVAWTRRYEWLDEEDPRCELLYTPQGASELVVLMTIHKPTATTARFPLFVRYALNGDFIDATGLNVEGAEYYSKGLAVEYDSAAEQPLIYITGFFGSPDLQMFLFGVDGARNNIYQRQWSKAGLEALPWDLKLVGDELIAGGWVDDGDWKPAVWRTDQATALDFRVQTNDSNVDARIFSIAPLGDALVHAGASAYSFIEWDAVEGDLTNSARQWLIGGGFFSNVEMALVEPEGSVSDLTYTLDDNNVPDDGLIFYTRLP